MIGDAMKNLNDRGFAISTMLYGILTMIILILMLLLSIMRSTYNKETMASEDVSYYLNKCIKKQVNLDMCYMANNYSCTDEYETYVSCVGGEANAIASGNLVSLRDLILDNEDVQNSGLTTDVTNATKRYVFTGDSARNYIKIGTKSGRIIALENDGSIKIMFDDATTEPIDKKSSTQAGSGVQFWTNSSTLRNSLQNKWNNMDYTSLFKVDGVYYFGAIYSTDNVGSYFSSMDTNINNNTEIAKNSFGIVSLADYLKASNSTECSLSSGTIANSMTKCRSGNWMNSVSSNSCHWTSTPYNGLSQFVTYSPSSVTGTALLTQCTANMVAYLKSNTMVGSNADGTAAHPYIVQLQ